MIETNIYQTKLTDELLASLKDEVRTDLFDIINNVEFIQRLISPNRKLAKDLERDKSGRILVDLCQPHLLVDMNYFRQAAIHFKNMDVIQSWCQTLIHNPNLDSD